MAHSEGWAKRLMGRIPEKPETILRRPSFWDPAFLRLFLDHSDELVFRDPQTGLRWAKVAPQLALLVPEDGGPPEGGESPDDRRRRLAEERQAHREDLVKAYAILGGAYRAVSRPDDAEEPYQTAVRLAASEAITPAARADLDQRLSYLRICQGRLDEAEALLSGALEALDDSDPVLLADVLLKQAYIHAELERFAEAIDLEGKALRMVNPKSSLAAARVHHSGVHNLAYAVSQSRSGDAWAALPYVRQAKKLLKGQRRSIPRHKLNWIEGLIWQRLGMDARAETAFKVARRGFIRLGAPWEIALVSLDLCALHRSCGEWSELEALAADTYRRFRELSGNTQAVAALSLVVDAVRARRGASAAIAAAREVVEARVVRP